MTPSSTAEVWDDALPGRASSHTSAVEEGVVAYVNLPRRHLAQPEHIVRVEAPGKGG